MREHPHVEQSRHKVQCRHRSREYRRLGTASVVVVVERQVMFELKSACRPARAQLRQRTQVARYTFGSEDSDPLRRAQPAGRHEATLFLESFLERRPKLERLEAGTASPTLATLGAQNMHELKQIVGMTHKPN